MSHEHEFKVMTGAELMALSFPEMPPEPATPPTFADLVGIEPRLAELHRDASRYAVNRDPDFCANAVWYGYDGHPGLKQILLELVGMERRPVHPLLSTRAAYDVAYDNIYDLLPDCRNCGCARLTL